MVVTKAETAFMNAQKDPSCAQQLSRVSRMIEDVTVSTTAGTSLMKKTAHVMTSLSSVVWEMGFVFLKSTCVMTSLTVKIAQMNWNVASFVPMDKLYAGIAAVYLSCTSVTEERNVPRTRMKVYVVRKPYQCGRPLVEEPSSSRIVGGTEATRGVWPWQVSLSKSDGGHICGASVLTNNWIVTAAHCFKLPTYDMDTSPGPWQAAFGIQDVTLSRYRIERRVKAIYVHPDYHPLYDDYDIAMVELVHPIEYNDYIMPICLPTYDMRPTNESTCYVTGWGATSEHGFTSDVLKQALLPVVPNVKCDELLATDIGPRMLCAGYDEGGTDACQGDSGGPFVCQKEAGDWYLAGVVSHGFGCARPNSPGVYSRVTEYLDYIYQFLQQ
uniref:Plasma kallikrein-like n=1 Tax=Saccoglossus kowalevskii TaxID=10224 RepID=A0ABM0LYQ0_SACKO|nr:PREDICTED: plasma kallikrein-like [Saccoglossus kowalevskii]